MTMSAPIATVFDTGDDSHFDDFRNRLNEKLPLEKLKWQATYSKRTHRISTLGLNLIPFDSAMLSQLDPSFDSNFPILHIALVYGEDNNIYKQFIKDRLSTWQKYLSQLMCGQNWLVVHVTPKVKGRGLRQIHIFDTLFDKLKNDFGNKFTADRFLQLAHNDEEISNSQELWTLFRERLGQEIIASFDSRVTYFEETIRNTFQSASIGGNRDTEHCSFFLIKDLYGMSFEAMNLQREALEQYDELESVFEIYLDKQRRSKQSSSSFSGTGAGAGADTQNLRAAAMGSSDSELMSVENPAFDAEAAAATTESTATKIIEAPSKRTEINENDDNWLRWFNQDCVDHCTEPVPLGSLLEADWLRKRVRDRKVLMIELRLYILNKQLALLLHLFRPDDIAHRVVRLLQQRIMPEMRDNWTEGKPSFVCEWVAVACLTTFKLTEQFIHQSIRNLGVRSRLQYALARAVLCICAKERLEQLGISRGMLPEPEPTFLRIGSDRFTTETPEPFQNRLANKPSDGSCPTASASKRKMFPSLRVLGEATDQTNAPDASNKDGVSVSAVVSDLIANTPVKTVQDALNSVELFDKLYLNLCQCAIESFEVASRKRSSLSVQCDMACLFFHRQNYLRAAEKFSVAIEYFRRDRWFALEVRLLQPLLQCYKMVNQFDQYVTTCLRTIVSECPISKQEKLHYWKRLVEFTADSSNSVVCELETVFEVVQLKIASKGRNQSPTVLLKLRNRSDFDIPLCSVNCVFEEHVNETEEKESKKDLNATNVREDSDDKENTKSLPSQGSMPIIDLGSPQKPKLEESKSRISIGYASLDVQDQNEDKKLEEIAELSNNGSQTDSSLEVNDGDPVVIDMKTKNALLYTANSMISVVDETDCNSEYQFTILANKTVSWELETPDNIEWEIYAARRIEVRWENIKFRTTVLPECFLRSSDQKPYSATFEFEERDCPTLVNTVETFFLNSCFSRKLSKSGIRVNTPSDVEFEIVGQSPNKSRVVINDSGIKLSTWSEYRTDFQEHRFQVQLKLACTESGLQKYPSESPLKRMLQMQAFGVGRTLEYQTLIVDKELSFVSAFKACFTVGHSCDAYFLRLTLVNALQQDVLILSYDIEDIKKDCGEVPNLEALARVCQGATSLNGFITLPCQLKPQQSFSMIWRLQPSFKDSILVKPDQMFGSKEFGCYANINFRILPIASNTDLPETNQFRHFMTFSLSEANLSCSLKLSPSASNLVVGEFTECSIVVSFLLQMDSAFTAAQLMNKGALFFTLITDSKRWMVAGRIMGAVTFLDDNLRFTHAVKLLPLVPGLLTLPKVKLLFQPRDQNRKYDVDFINLSASVQVRVLPTPDIPAITRLSLF